MYYVAPNPEEALRVPNEVESQLADNRCFLLKKAEINAELEDYPAALGYLRKINALHLALLGTGQDFKEMYWDRVLLAEADCHRKIKDYDSAVKCYLDILGQEIDLESTTVQN
ncbi:predicted protein [Plenodomus lingam JN3]|uniref:Predicted protein n=1 Tax=Leptosphaeria maculans (strain JN3 / isolate v23.1.3 / race Av1-4-5-6-7-8) TaxID=985895 RepID=E5ADZ9_LEPMJ|nr:predicted protein [Plenodomus lingam JN3]CBY01438.1 predicted protein [Plenodomus lingam JN3]